MHAKFTGALMQIFWRAVKDKRTRGLTRLVTWFLWPVFNEPDENVGSCATLFVRRQTRANAHCSTSTRTLRAGMFSVSLPLPWQMHLLMYIHRNDIARRCSFKYSAKQKCSEISALRIGIETKILHHSTLIKWRVRVYTENNDVKSTASV